MIQYSFKENNMNTRQLFSQFSQGINWNAFLYIAYKTLFTALSFTLLQTLSTKDFSLWANINSMVFLLLLWVDFGLRKSVPRFAPEFAQTNNQIKQFITSIVLFQVAALLFGLLPLHYLLSALTKILHYPQQIFIITSFLFISEGIVSTIRLFYHSYFLHKQFNCLSIIIMIIEMTINMLLIKVSPHGINLVYAILTNKIVANTIIILSSGSMLALSLPKIKMRGKNKKTPTKEFMKHSTIMWASNNLKSISERNFLVPFLTAIIGPALANLFKVANDAALFFYRIAIKTIGTTDTSLLSFIHTAGHKQKLMRFAFTKLTTKVVGLCFPLLGIISIIGIQGSSLFNNPFVFQAFLIMATGYILETLFLPFERILEIKGNYYDLLIGYIPYICMIILLFNKTTISFIGLLSFIALIHSVRLVSIIIIALRAHTLYNVNFPIRHLIIYVKLLTKFPKRRRRTPQPPS